jgi:O-antigen/teichoic acid export membrane protein
VSASAPKSGSSIAGRIIRAAGAQGVTQLVRVGQLFLLVPICLGAWGTAVYEDWLLVNSIVAFLVLADFGFVQFTTVKLIETWSRGEHERFSREWGLALGYFGALSTALICILGALWAVPGWTSLIAARVLAAGQLASIAAMLSLGQLLSILIMAALAAYRARGDMSRSYNAWSILVIAQTAAIAIPALLGKDPMVAATGNFVMTAATLAAILVDLRRRYPDMRWKPIWPSFDEFVRRQRDAIGYLVSPLATTIMVFGPNLILAHTGAPEGAITLYTTTRTIAGVARQLPYQFAHPAGVELAGLLAREDWEGLGRVYASASRALAIIVGALSGFTIVAAPLVMTVWTRGKVGYDPILMLLLVGTTTICAPAQVAYTLLFYGGYPGRFGKALALSTGLSLGIATLLSPWFDVRGIAAGFGVGEIVGVAIYLSLLVDGLLKRKAGAGLFRNFSIAAAAFLASAGSAMLIHRLIEPRGWFGLIALGAAWVVPAAAGAYWTLLSRPQQARAISVAAGLVRGLKGKSLLRNAKPVDFG